MELVPESKAYFKCSCQSCGGHIEFPASAAGATVACPHCNWQTVLQAPPAASVPAPRVRQNRISIVIAAVILLAAAGAVGYRHFANSSAPAQDNPISNPAVTVAPKPVPPPPPPAPPPDPWHGLMASAVRLEKAEEGGLVYAMGTLKNQSDHQRFGVKVQLNLFDEQGQKVGTSTDYTASIVPGKEWRFKALVVERKAVRAEIASVTEQE